MTTMYRRFKRWQRLRKHRAPLDWLCWLSIGGLAVIIGTALWGLLLYSAVLSFKHEILEKKNEQLRLKLHDTEIMLIACLNGGTAAYVDEEKYRVYIECPTKAKERIYS